MDTDASLRMNCGHEGTRRGEGVIRNPTGLPTTSQSPSPADGPLRGEF